MNPQTTPLFARTSDGVYLVIGWMFDGSRANNLDAVGVRLGSGAPTQGEIIGSAKFFVDLAQAQKARP